MTKPTNSELAEVARAALDYIDALPGDVVAKLPVMPGFDRDWAESAIAAAQSVQQKHGETISELAAVRQQLAAVTAENAQMLRLLTDISENHEEHVNVDDYMYAGVPLDYVSEINMYVSRDVNAENPFQATDAALAEIRAQGADMVAKNSRRVYRERHNFGDISTAAEYLTAAVMAENIAQQLRGEDSK